MLENVEIIFEKKEMMMKHLKKAGYIQNMEIFRNEYGHFFDEMVSYVDLAEDKTSAAKTLADDFAGKVRDAHLNRFGRVSGKTQADLNLFMVYYVFPAIQLTENPVAKAICDAICASWVEKFPGNKIGYTTYEALIPQFKEKIFGIF